MYEKWPEITEETTMEDIKKIHQKIWQYAIEHGEKPTTPYHSDCVLCEYSMIARFAIYKGEFSGLYIRLPVCSLCPFKGEMNMKLDAYSRCLGGLWSRWGNCIPFGDFKSAKEIAAKIRDIEICTDEEMQERIQKFLRT